MSCPSNADWAGRRCCRRSRCTAHGERPVVTDRGAIAVRLLPSNHRSRSAWRSTRLRRACPRPRFGSSSWCARAAIDVVITFLPVGVLYSSNRYHCLAGVSSCLPPFAGNLSPPTLAARPSDIRVTAGACCPLEILCTRRTLARFYRSDPVHRVGCFSVDASSRLWPVRSMHPPVSLS